MLDLIKKNKFVLATVLFALILIVALIWQSGNRDIFTISTFVILALLITPWEGFAESKNNKVKKKK